jgi:hypothetical protein
MAKLTDLNDPKHRKLAGQFVDDKLLARLSPAELRHRVAHAARLRADALASPERDHAAALFEQSRKVLRSDPVAEYIHEHKRLSDAQRKAPMHLQSIYHAAVAGHRERNQYAPHLVAACNQILLGRPVVGDDHLAMTAEECVSHYARTAKQ